DLSSVLAAECGGSRQQAAAEELAYKTAQGQPPLSEAKWIGVDPAFVSTSPMFDPSLDVDGWYNTTPGSPEVNRFGVSEGAFFVAFALLVR
ncbi:hypothetical protein DUNSADRAFT_4576, partial [Dunaliella salina]